MDMTQHVVYKKVTHRLSHCFLSKKKIKKQQGLLDKSFFL